MPIDDIVDPVAFSAWWAWTGVALLVAVTVWLVVLFVVTRRRSDEDQVREPLPPATYAAGSDPFVDVRVLCLTKIDEVERAFYAEEIDVRELHLRLSTIVREFAGRRRGIDTSVMTLTDLEHLTGAGRLANLIARYYQPAFARTTQETGVEGLDGARTVVSSW
ncbi:hypothetical protein [Sanguibacter antarcticus]|uniref:Uncharacterized protein n=1 Tax=Sanguibacter antarcticus TaxID=372484 RepID=A0A2A9E7R3_9MICO|nr:hypothetical protein [Sanguibacter antarcticus]PFG34998.1 hypothetical protein ATL42_2930 [Sanguibacter antarcticus]